MIDKILNYFLLQLLISIPVNHSNRYEMQPTQNQDSRVPSAVRLS